MTAEEGTGEPENGLEDGVEQNVLSGCADERTVTQSPCDVEFDPSRHRTRTQQRRRSPAPRDACPPTLKATIHSSRPLTQMLPASE